MTGTAVLADWDFPPPRMYDTTLTLFTMTPFARSAACLPCGVAWIAEVSLNKGGSRTCWLCGEETGVTYREYIDAKRAAHQNAALSTLTNGQFVNLESLP